MHAQDSLNASPPVVSVIMNCYNSAQTLEASLLSVLKQTFDNFEIIFFDNGSSDASFSIAQSYSRKDSRLQCTLYQERTSLGEARNRAIALARGQFLAFLDCDDLWEPQKLALQVAYMQAHLNVDLLCTDTQNFSKTSRMQRFFATSQPERGAVFGSLVRRQWIALSSAMLRMSALQNIDNKDSLPRLDDNIICYFDQNLSLCEEAEIFYRVAYHGHCDYLPELLTYRRVHSGCISFTQFERWHVETRYMADKLQVLYPQIKKEHPDAIAALYDRALFQEVLNLWREGYGKKARARLFSQKIFAHMTSKQKLFLPLSFLPPSLFALCTKIYLRWGHWL